MLESSFEFVVEVFGGFEVGFVLGQESVVETWRERSESRITFSSVLFLGDI